MEIKHLPREQSDIFEIIGRIDGLTSGELKKTLDHAAAEGSRSIILDFSGVTYMSSAGLRIILLCHKSLHTIGGKLNLVSIPSMVGEVFRVSGMDGFLNIFPDRSFVIPSDEPGGREASMEVWEFEGIQFEHWRCDASDGVSHVFGDPRKLDHASYCEEDVVAVDQGTIAFGAGLAATGGTYRDYHAFFGESVILQHHFFSYPAVPRPQVDFSLHSGNHGGQLHFLYGFGFTGKFSQVLWFDLGRNTVSLGSLIRAALQLAVSDIFGVVVLAASAGIQGMHLRKVPVSGNFAGPGTIFDMDHFPRWINFPADPEDYNKTVAACGIVAKDGKVPAGDWQIMIPEAGRSHIHALVMENALWSNNVFEFEKELQRVLRDLNPEKVVHLLPDSLLKSGYLAIVNLKTD